MTNTQLNLLNSILPSDLSKLNNLSMADQNQVLENYLRKGNDESLFIVNYLAVVAMYSDDFMPSDKVDEFIDQWPYASGSGFQPFTVTNDEYSCTFRPSMEYHGFQWTVLYQGDTHGWDVILESNGAGTVYIHPDNGAIAKSLLRTCSDSVQCFDLSIAALKLYKSGSLNAANLFAVSGYQASDLCEDGQSIASIILDNTETFTPSYLVEVLQSYTDADAVLSADESNHWSFNSTDYRVKSFSFAAFKGVVSTIFSAAQLVVSAFSSIAGAAMACVKAVYTTVSTADRSASEAVIIPEVGNAILNVPFSNGYINRSRIPANLDNLVQLIGAAKYCGPGFVIYFWNKTVDQTVADGMVAFEMYLNLNTLSYLNYRNAGGAVPMVRKIRQQTGSQLPVYKWQVYGGVTPTQRLDGVIPQAAVVPLGAMSDFDLRRSVSSSFCYILASLYPNGAEGVINEDPSNPYAYTDIASILGALGPEGQSNGVRKNPLTWDQIINVVFPNARQTISVDDDSFISSLVNNTINGGTILPMIGPKTVPGVVAPSYTVGSVWLGALAAGAAIAAIAVVGYSAHKSFRRKLTKDRLYCEQSIRDAVSSGDPLDEEQVAQLHKNLDRYNLINSISCFPTGDKDLNFNTISNIESLAKLITG